MNRTFLMPAISAVALCVTNTACTNIEKQFINDWVGASFSDGANFYELPQVYTEVDGAVTYTYLSNFRMLIQEDGEGAFGSYYLYTSSAGDNEREEYLYVGTWERIKGREFTIAVEEDDIEMSCTLESESELDCSYSLSFTTYDGGTETYEIDIALVPRFP